MKKVVTLGEIMLRLSTINNNRITQSEYFQINYGGGEANVAISLNNLGIKTEFVTKIPKNELGKSVIKYLKSNDVIVDNIVVGGERLGTYYLEKGNGVRNSSVIYDRKNSSFTELKYEDLNIDKILEDCSILHLSGITPALSENNKDLMEKIIIEAKKRDILISFDFNYRSKLWTLEEARETIKTYLPYIDICFMGILDCEKLLKMNPRKTLKEYYKDLTEKYPNIKYLISTEREINSIDNNSLKGFLYCDNNLYESKTYTFDIVDRVGGGDAFAAGILYGIYNENSLEEIVEFGTGASVYKHSINGDGNLGTVEEIKGILQGKLNNVDR
ncbi:MAG: sugar kinase [Cetobacterium sp.]|nr:sugar kinase [Cetobacterium sp.]